MSVIKRMNSLFQKILVTNDTLSEERHLAETANNTEEGVLDMSLVNEVTSYLCVYLALLSRANRFSVSVVDTKEYAHSNIFNHFEACINFTDMDGVEICMVKLNQLFDKIAWNGNGNCFYRKMKA